MAVKVKRSSAVRAQPNHKSVVGSLLESRSRKPDLSSIKARPDNMFSVGSSELAHHKEIVLDHSDIQRSMEYGSAASSPAVGPTVGDGRGIEVHLMSPERGGGSPPPVPKG
jgi:hypothetical protein